MVTDLRKCQISQLKIMTVKYVKGLAPVITLAVFRSVLKDRDFTQPITGREKMFKLGECIKKIRSTPRGNYIIDNLIPVSIAVMSIISPAIFLSNPHLYNDLSISFLPGSLDFVWLSLWFVAGSLIMTGIIQLSKMTEASGWFLLTSVLACYAIVLTYKNGFNSLLIMSLIPGLAVGSLARAVILITKEVTGLDRIKNNKK